jgi:hypothetical protein
MDKTEQGSAHGNKAVEVPGAAGLVCPPPAVATREGPAPRAAASSDSFMLAPGARKSIVTTQIRILEGLSNVRFDSSLKSDFVRFGPIADKRGCGRIVRFVPRADIAPAFSK